MMSVALPPKVSIIVVSWNCQDVLIAALRSIFAQTTVPFEIIVSDNASSDDTLILLRENFSDTRLKVIANDENLGFSMGNNIALPFATGQYVLLLNPDTLILDHAIDQLLTFADQQPDVGAFGTLILNDDYSYQISARPFPTIRTLWLCALGLRKLPELLSNLTTDYYPRWHGETVRSIDWQSGCCLLLRRSLLDDLAGFDPQFFFHYDEVDLCKRIWDSGSSIVFYPGASVVHYGGVSSAQVAEKILIESLRNQFRFFRKHFGDRAMRHAHLASLVHYALRGVVYSCLSFGTRNVNLLERAKRTRACFTWLATVNPADAVQGISHSTPS